MTIKRKRSDDSSSSDSLSTPETQSPSFFSRYDGAMDMDMDTDSSSRPNPWSFANASRVKSSDWGYRTRKRFRDNRPDEQSIHETTLTKLFAAQHTPLASPLPPPPTQPTHTRPLLHTQKSTLHSFWKQLPTPPVRPLIFPIQPRQPQHVLQLPQCDDCDAPLVNDGHDMDVDMDCDMGGAVEGSPFSCCECGKSVCGTCAVVGARRVCLGCATKGGKGSRWW
ncbi:hypothetical protein NX059_004580 [Plenodomus lindquistii]|nr:hypothetical protein NX059_004580 [Plenodomus lindquistii]